MKMKEKNLNWLSRNSNWLFIILLLCAIIILNLVIENIKYISFNFSLSTLIVLIILSILLILIIGFLGLIIYLEDELSGRNKRHIAIYDRIIERLNIKRSAK